MHYTWLYDIVNDGSAIWDALLQAMLGSPQHGKAVDSNYATFFKCVILPGRCLNVRQHINIYV